MSRKAKKAIIIVVDVDMEGISGIGDYHQVLKEFRPFEKSGRSLITEDVNAVVRGLRAGGATEIRVVDDHGSGGASPKNIISEKLEKGVRLYQGPDMWGRLGEAIDNSVTAAVLLGFHAMAKAENGFLTHTIDPMLAGIKINGKPVGETALAALKFAEHGIPVIMVTGDQALVREALEFLPGIETVQVKTSLSIRKTKCMPPVKARKLIAKAAKRAVSKVAKLKPLSIQSPYRIEISFPTKEHVEIAKIIPRARRSGETAVSYDAQNFDEGEAFINTAITLAARLRLRTMLAEIAKLDGFSRIEKRFYGKFVADWLSQ